MIGRQSVFWPLANLECRRNLDAELSPDGDLISTLLMGQSTFRTRLKDKPPFSYLSRQQKKKSSAGQVLSCTTRTGVVFPSCIVITIRSLRLMKQHICTDVAHGRSNNKGNDCQQACQFVRQIEDPVWRSNNPLIVPHIVSSRPVLRKTKETQSCVIQGDTKEVVKKNIQKKTKER